jgi:hypothetical protein
MYGGYGGYGGGGYGNPFSEQGTDMWINQNVPGGINSKYYRWIVGMINEIEIISLPVLLI